MSLPKWVADYIGLPFQDKGRTRDGLDCWGLFWLVSREHFGRDLPVYVDGYDKTKDLEDIARLISRELADWRKVRPQDARPGDGILIRMTGEDCHVGLVVAPGWMLHIEEGIGSCVDRTTGTRWAQRIIGYYRHKE